jgi:uncharacterized protein (DUF488 family)
MHPIYTLGYRAWTPAAFVQRVAALGAVVADIRFAPFSWQRFWQTQRLQQELGARYRHLRALGNIAYKTGGPIALVDLEAGLTTLAEVLEAALVILLCACADVQRCHRRLVAEAWTARYGQTVTHLEPPVTAETVPLFPEHPEERSRA